jgi:DNA segregation ATPase FtsK/SpoIIIE-like protein
VNNFEEPDYEAAVKVCRDLGRISVSAIQRNLRMGYVKACLIVEEMGKRGIAEQVDPDGAWVFIANTPD